jgi:hypothetical protein
MKGNQTQDFSTFDIQKILNVERERMREWMNRGFIIPTAPAEGQGTKAVFTIFDIYKIAVFKKLVEAGISRRIASSMVNTSTKLDLIEEVRNLSFILVLVREKRYEWINYLEPGPWTFEEDITQDSNWNTGILINFKKLRAEIESSL